MANPKPPATVQVGPLIYTVRVSGERAADADSYGFTDHDKSEIVLDSKITPSHSRVTILHELLHAVIKDAVGALRGGKAALLPDRDTEEQLVTAVAPWLLETLRRNPDLVTYLLADV